MRFLFFFLIAFANVNAQNIYSLHTQWDDDIKQWDIVLNEGEIEGTIEMKWRLRNDITEWTYRIGDRRGTIQRKWDNNANVWELRSGSTLVKMSTIWTGEFNSWRISDESNSLKIERPYITADPIEWKAMGDLEKDFFWYNENAFDIRDWVVEDFLPEEYSLELKLAAVFISILHSL